MKVRIPQFHRRWLLFSLSAILVMASLSHQCRAESKPTIAENPQIMIVIAESNLGNVSPASIVEAQIRSVLLTKGFHVIDADVAEQNELREMTKGLKGVTDYQTAVTIAQKHGADILVLGTAFTEQKAQTQIKGSFTAHVVQAYAEVRVVHSRSAQVIGSNSFNAQAFAPTDRTAGVKALERISVDIIASTLETIAQGPDSERTIELVVNGVASLTVEQKIQQELSQLRATTGVYRRSWANGIAVYDLKSSASIDDIAGCLETLTSVHVRVIGVTLHTIQANLVED